MKTSNKILLAAFLTFFAVLAVVQFTLYARYKGGLGVVEGDYGSSNYTSHRYTGVNVVVLKDLQNMEIVPGDSLLWQAPVGTEDQWKIVQSGDSLLMSPKFVGDSTTVSAPVTDGHNYNSYATVTAVTRQYMSGTLQLPPSVLLRLRNAEVFLSREARGSLRAELWNSSLNNHGYDSTQRIDNLDISAYDSDVRLTLESLRSGRFALVQSLLELRELHTDSLQISTDNDSRLELPSRLFFKAKITPHHDSTARTNR